MRKPQNLAAAYMLALNTFLIFVAMPVMLFLEEAHAQASTPTQRRILVTPIGGVPGKPGLPQRLPEMLRKAIANRIEQSGLGQVISTDQVDAALSTGLYDPTLERILSLSARLGADLVLRVRITDHLRLDGDIYAVALRSELREGAEGRLIHRGQSVRSFPSDRDPEHIARIEAAKLVASSFSAKGGIPAQFAVAPEPPQKGVRIPEVPPPSPTTLPEVEFLGTGAPADSLSRDPATRVRQTRMGGTTAPKLFTDRPQREDPGVIARGEAPVSPEPPAPRQGVDLSTPAPGSQVASASVSGSASHGPRRGSESTHAASHGSRQGQGPAPGAASAPPSTRPAASAAPAPRAAAARLGSSEALRPDQVPDSERIPIATVYFSSGSSRLDARNQAALDQIATALASRTQLPILIEGHADSRGDRDENYALSRRRANTVRDYLKGRGLHQPGRILSYGLSEDVPQEASNSPEAHARNRRAEIFLLVADGEMAQAITGGMAATAEAPSAGVLPSPRSGEVLPDALVAATVDQSATATSGAATASLSDEHLRPAQRRIRELLAKYQGGDELEDGADSGLDEAPPRDPRDNRVRPGDTLRVTVQGRSELTKNVTVRDDGRLPFPLVDAIPVDGLTIRDVENKLTEGLSQYVVEPRVHISRIYEIRVFGRVQRQGVFQFDHAPSFPELLGECEGLAIVPDTASQGNVQGVVNTSLIARVLKSSSGTPSEYNLNHFLATGRGLEDLHLGHGDVVIIEYDQKNFITVMGEITNTVIYKSGLRLMEALSMARGFGNEEKQNIKNVRVLRRLPDGAIQRIEVNIHDIIHRGQLNRDIELQAGDYVIVPRRSKRFTVLSGIRDLLQPVLQVGFLKQIF